MDRLTFYDDSGNPCYRTKEYSSFFGKEIDVVISGSDVARKLAEYEDAEERGLLVHLPCAFGSVIYMTHFIHKCEGCPDNTYTPVERCKTYTVEGCKRMDKQKIYEVSFCAEMFNFEVGKLKRNYYLTREEAEAAAVKVRELFKGNGGGNCE